jgi:hypothetical protein
MKKLLFQHSFARWLILAAAVILFPGPAQAFVITDFSQWTDMGPNMGLFFQQTGGPLYFNDPVGGQKDILKSPDPATGAFFVALRYSSFSSNNDNLPNAGLASIAALDLTADNCDVFVMEGQVSPGKFFQTQVKDHATGVVKTLFQVYFVSDTSGRLGIGYNGVSGAGGLVTFWYDVGAGWKQIGPPYSPNFSGDLYFQIMGKDGPDATMSFQVSEIDVSPGSTSPVKPLPGVVLLLLEE